MSTHQHSTRVGILWSYTSPRHLHRTANYIPCSLRIPSSLITPPSIRGYRVSTSSTPPDLLTQRPPRIIFQESTPCVHDCRQSSDHKQSTRTSHLSQTSKITKHTQHRATHHSSLISVEEALSSASIIREPPYTQQSSHLCDRGILIGLINFLHTWDIHSQDQRFSIFQLTQHSIRRVNLTITTTRINDIHCITLIQFFLSSSPAHTLIPNLRP